MHGMIMKVFRGMASRHLFRSTSGPHFGMLLVAAAFAATLRRAKKLPASLAAKAAATVERANRGIPRV